MYVNPSLLIYPSPPSPGNHKIVFNICDSSCFINTFICTIFLDVTYKQYICLSLSDLLHSVWQYLDSPILLKMALLHSFLWLSNITFYFCILFSFNIIFKNWICANPQWYFSLYSYFLYSASCTDWFFFSKLRSKICFDIGGLLIHGNDSHLDRHLEYCCHEALPGKTMRKVSFLSSSLWSGSHLVDWIDWIMN